MKTKLLFALGAGILMLHGPLQADLLTNNFWPNPSFEEGQDLADPAQGVMAQWTRWGNDPSICTISTARSVSPSHALALEDLNGDGYGIWYADYPLGGLLREGSVLNMQWHEIYKVDNEEMRITVDFADGSGKIFGAQHFTVRGQSKGWKGNLAGSTFTKRNETVALPTGTKSFRIELVSGGPAATTGIYLIDDFSISLGVTSPQVLFRNIWPNPGFEEGTNLDNPTTAQPTNWRRSGADPSIAQLIHENYLSSTHALALVDNGSGLGQWEADLSLEGRASAGNPLSVQWFELYQIEPGGEMQMIAMFLGSGGAVLSRTKWVVQGQSSGWMTNLPSSNFSKRLETLIVPAGASLLRFVLASGGTESSAGIMVIDDLSVSAPPRPPVILQDSFWPNPGFEQGAQLEQPKTAQVTGWSRGGSDASFDQLSSVNFRSTSHALALVDTRDDAYGEWYRNHDISELVKPGDVLQAQWWWVYDISGEMRLTFIFFDSADGQLLTKNYFVRDQSPGWMGNMAASPFIKQVARLPVPDGATRLAVNFASGGSQSVTGSVLLDDLSVRVAPPNPDTDGDGMLDGDEELAGTSPEDAASVLRITECIEIPGGARLTWNSVPGRRYTVESTYRLGDLFQPVPGGEGILASETDSTTVSLEGRSMMPAQVFYRVRLIE